MEVLGRVLVLRAVAASDVTAHEAEAKVHPGVAGGEAFLASGCARRDVARLAYVAAVARHGILWLEGTFYACGACQPRWSIDSRRPGAAVPRLQSRLPCPTTSTGTSHRSTTPSPTRRKRTRS